MTTEASTTDHGTLVNNAPIGIGIVGAGFIADSHAHAIAAHPTLRLAAVTDQNPVAAAALAVAQGARVQPDLGALLADPAVEAVIVCTPNDTHVAIARAVAEAGRHLLMEKPLALNRADAQDITDRFQAAGLVLMVGHTHRHSDYALAVRRTIQDGAVGEVRSMRIAITGGWIWGGWGSWVLDPVRSGGHAFHNGVHLYDLARWWLDSEIRSAWAVGQRLTSAALGIDDYLCATLETASGAAAVCEISRGERPRSASVFEIVVHGTSGTLVRQWTSDGLVRLSDDGSGAVPAGGRSPFLRQLESFRAAVRDGAPVDPPPAHAVEAIAVAEAVAESARSAQVVGIAA